jgi:hypothetical protein
MIPDIDVLRALIIGFTVALSTIEAEYTALSNALREILAHLTFFNSISLKINYPNIYTDNEAAESIVKRDR